MNSQLLYFFNDARVLYSAEQLESLVTDGITAPDTIVHTISLPFKASDVIQHIAPIVNDHLVSVSDDPTLSL